MGERWTCGREKHEVRGVSGIEQPKIVEAATWLRVGNGVMFQNQGKNIGMVQGTFAIFEAVEPEDFDPGMLETEEVV